MIVDDQLPIKMEDVYCDKESDEDEDVFEMDVDINLNSECGDLDYIEWYLYNDLGIPDLSGRLLLLRSCSIISQ